MVVFGVLEVLKKPNNRILFSFLATSSLSRPRLGAMASHMQSSRKLSLSPGLARLFEPQVMHQLRDIAVGRPHVCRRVTSISQGRVPLQSALGALRTPSGEMVMRIDSTQPSSHSSAREEFPAGLRTRTGVAGGGSWRSSSVYQGLLKTVPSFSKMEPSSSKTEPTAQSPRRALSDVGGGGSGAGNDGRGGGGGGGGGEGSEEGAGGPWASLAAGYMALLESRPLLTKALTAGLLNALADVICQVVVEQGGVFDFRRLASLTAIGAILVGPVLHVWYGLLGTYITVQGLNGVLLRLFIDQIVFSPFCIATFLALVLFLEGKASAIPSKLEQDTLPTLLNMWKLYIPFQLLNFSLIPPQLQVAAASVIGVLWTVYISFVSHK